jgi:hypothetical protein
MAGKAPPSQPLTALVLGGAFLFLLAFFLDSVWVVGAQVWMHAFGERTQGRVIGDFSYTKTGRNGRPYRVTIYSYEYQDAAGVTHVHQTGQKSFLFSKERRGSYKPYGPLTVPVTVLHRPGPFSWAVEYEGSVGENLFLAAVLLIPLLGAGLGVFPMLRAEEAGRPNVSRPSPRAQKHRQRKKRRR